MTLESGRSGHVLVDVLDRVLDKGIVIDAAVRISVVGIELLGVDARVVVASIETYLLHADTLAYTDLAAGPRRGELPPASDPEAHPTPASALLVAQVPPEPESPAPPLYAEPAEPAEPADPADPRRPVADADPDASGLPAAPGNGDPSPEGPEPPPDAAGPAGES